MSTTDSGTILYLNEFTFCKKINKIIKPIKLNLALWIHFDFIVSSCIQRHLGTSTILSIDQAKIWLTSPLPRAVRATKHICHTFFHILHKQMNALSVRNCDTKWYNFQLFHFFIFIFSILNSYSLDWQYFMICNRLTCIWNWAILQDEGSMQQLLWAQTLLTWKPYNLMECFKFTQL